MKTTKKTTTKKTAVLAQLIPNSKPSHGRFTNEEVAEILATYRRGITLRQISEALGYKDSKGSGMALRASLGSWALKNAIVPKEK